MTNVTANHNTREQICVVLTTCPNRDSANQLASALLDKKLAACVQVTQSVTSFYRWNGQIQQDSEYQVMIKTQQQCIDAAFKLTLSIHPYDVPQWIVLGSVMVSQPYLDWIKSSLA